MRILLAFNGSELSQAALHAVLQQHRPKNTEVLVLYVAPVDEWTGETSRARGLVAEAAQALRTAGFPAVETTLLKGESSGTIVYVAEKWHADLIVLGWHGRTRLKRLLFGSMADLVVHGAPCSVELVRTREELRQPVAMSNAGH